MMRIAPVAVVCALLACGGDPAGQQDGRGAVAASADAPASYGLGRAATPAEIAGWDLDVNPAGEGLPAGSGSARQGAVVYAAKCVACHGPRGEGVAPNPPIVGREPREGFPFGESLEHVKTVGNYWPYATTIYDYLRRAMPQDRPGSLEPNELYALTAWILAANGIIDSAAVLDSGSLPRVRMPARERFVRDDRAGGSSFR